MVKNKLNPHDRFIKALMTNKKVITENFNKAVAEELARHIDPSLPGKTLIFAASNDHADIVVKQVKEAFILGIKVTKTPNTKWKKVEG